MKLLEPLRHTVRTAAPLLVFCTMDELANESPRETAMRLRLLATGLSDPADVAAIARYADEIERSLELKPLINWSAPTVQMD